MPFSFNGNQVELDTAINFADEADSNFIFLETHEPLTNSQEAELQNYGVKFLEYLSDNTWLCKYEPADLVIIRGQAYVANAAVVDPRFKIHPPLMPYVRRGSQEKHTVDITLHQEAIMSAEEVAASIRKLSGASAEEVGLRRNSVRLEVDQEALLKIAKIDDVASIERVREMEAQETAQEIESY
ncbi:subtilisin-like protease [Colletotrichum karsti]|uniref:Subtilisin-like protease n=1 Tax=Colletotrichum karsti TaxID=1095194 RepID=A0A9P6I2P6_9PEZI|nr:subtilisin-like protease [Colletotrichum karsti]KAF9874944.1 subtilisin-like protease [Colletotrichum karsti]